MYMSKEKEKKEELGDQMCKNEKKGKEEELDV